MHVTVSTIQQISETESRVELRLDDGSQDGQFISLRTTIEHRPNQSLPTIQVAALRVAREAIVEETQRLLALSGPALRVAKK